MAIAGRKTSIKTQNAPVGTLGGAIQAMPKGLQDHPLRAALTAEVHARPFARLEAPERIGALFEHFGLVPPGAGANHAMADFGAFRFKCERHTEFSS